MADPQSHASTDDDGRERRARRPAMRIPMWVLVSGITILVLVGVVIGSMLLGGSGMGDHRPAAAAMGTDHNGDGRMGGPDHAVCPSEDHRGGRRA